MAINSDGSGSSEESSAAPSRKEMKRGVRPELQNSVDEPTLCNGQV